MHLPPGTRIELTAMPNDVEPIKRGTRGTVQGVRNLGAWVQVEIIWDSGRTLMLTVPPDRFRLVPIVQMAGQDGNAHSILGRAMAAMRRANWSQAGDRSLRGGSNKRKL